MVHSQCPLSVIKADKYLHTMWYHTNSQTNPVLVCTLYVYSLPVWLCQNHKYIHQWWTHRQTVHPKPQHTTLMRPNNSCLLLFHLCLWWLAGQPYPVYSWAVLREEGGGGGRIGGHSHPHPLAPYFLKPSPCRLWKSIKTQHCVGHSTCPRATRHCFSVAVWFGVTWPN